MTTPIGNNAILVLTNLPDINSAEKLAQNLITAQLVACVNILAPCTSMYQWQDKLEKTTEVPMMIKASRDHYPEIEATILKHHPYELPEIIFIGIDGGLPDYLAWVTSMTANTT